MALKIHNLKFKIIHALVVLKNQCLDYSIRKDNPEYLQKRNELLKRLENMRIKP